MAQIFYDPSKLTDEEKALLDRISIDQDTDLQNRVNEYITSGQYQKDLKYEANAGKSLFGN